MDIRKIVGWIIISPFVIVVVSSLFLMVGISWGLHHALGVGRITWRDIVESIKRDW